MNKSHTELYHETLAKYGYEESNTEVAALFYCLTQVTERVETFLDTNLMSEISGIYINPDSLTNVLSSSEITLVSLGFHLFTGNSEYAVPEIAICRLSKPWRNVALNAIRIRCGEEL